MIPLVGIPGPPLNHEYNHVGLEPLELLNCPEADSLLPCTFPLRNERIAACLLILREDRVRHAPVREQHYPLLPDAVLLDELPELLINPKTSKMRCKQRRNCCYQCIHRTPDMNNQNVNRG